VPNKVTAKAIDELEAGRGKRFEQAGDLFEDLGI
jgi:DNA-damage-inducible protein J